LIASTNVTTNQATLLVTEIFYHYSTINNFAENR